MLQTLHTPTSPLPPRLASARHEPAAAPGVPRWLEPALQSAGMASLLDRDGELLLLAPSDAALQAHLLSLSRPLTDWLSDPAQTRQLLLEHLLCAPELPRLAADERPVATLAGRTLWLRSAGRSARLSVRAGPALDATAAPEPLRCGRLRLLCIDRVLACPPAGLLDLLAAEPGHQRMLQALRVSGHDALLRTHAAFTLLAPQDSGWAALAARMKRPLPQLLADPALLGQIVERHLIPGRWLSHQLPWGAQLRSAGAQPVQCTALGLIGCHCQAQPLLPGSDRQTATGVLHRLAEPLMPCPAAAHERRPVLSDLVPTPSNQELRHV